jgi:hypothetical protein
MTTRLRTCLRTLGVMVALLSAPLAWADFFIVVQSGNPQRSLTEREAVELFMGRTRSFSNGDFALVFDLPREHPRRAAFYKALTGMTAAQVNSYWSRLMFSGQSMPPQALPDEQAMVEIVKRNPSALGWLAHEPSDKALRTLLVLKEPR